jgi:hypothetical protein
MKQVFVNTTCDLNKTVMSEPDFLLGAFCTSTLDRSAGYLLRRQIKATPEEYVWINYFVFSRAPEFKGHIRKAVGL